MYSWPPITSLSLLSTISRGIIDPGENSNIKRDHRHTVEPLLLYFHFCPQSPGGNNRSRLGVNSNIKRDHQHTIEFPYYFTSLWSTITRGDTKPIGEFQYKKGPSTYSWSFITSLSLLSTIPWGDNRLRGEFQCTVKRVGVLIVPCGSQKAVLVSLRVVRLKRSTAGAFTIEPKKDRR